MTSFGLLVFKSNRENGIEHDSENEICRGFFGKGTLFLL